MTTSNMSSSTPSRNTRTLSSLLVASQNLTASNEISDASYMTSVPPEENLGPPNHLVDTRVFNVTSNSCLIHAEPFPVTFIGFRVNQPNHAVMRVFNKSMMTQRFHIIPPASSVFTIQYKKVRYFVPGSTLKVDISFTPAEQRYHEDRVLIHCQDEFNLLVPIQAYPSVTFAAFPRHIRLPDTQIGRQLTHRIPLVVDTAVETQYQVRITEPCDVMEVTPTEGVLPQDGSTAELTVTYRPRQYNTARTTLQLFLSDCGLPPATCTIAGRCVPGLRRDRQVEEQSRHPVVQHRTHPVLPPSGSIGPQHSLSFLAMQDDEPGRLNLMAHGDVAKFLLQKFAASVVVQTTFLERSESSLANASREQERSFNRARLQRASWLAEKTQVRRGQRPLSENSRQRVLQQRDQLWHEYSNPASAQETAREPRVKPHVKYVNKKLLRNAADPPLWHMPSYDIYKNDPWTFRLAAMERFIQAGRTIIIRNRAEKRLAHLRLLIEVMQEAVQEEDEGEDEEEEEGEYEEEEDHIYSDFFNPPPGFECNPCPEVKHDNFSPRGDQAYLTPGDYVPSVSDDRTSSVTQSAPPPTEGTNQKAPVNPGTAPT